jgi:hypothetical protein
MSRREWSLVTLVVLFMVLSATQAIGLRRSANETALALRAATAWEMNCGPKSMALLIAPELGVID